MSKDNTCFFCQICHENAVTKKDVMLWTANEHARRDTVRKAKEETHQWVADVLYPNSNLHR